MTNFPELLNSCGFSSQSCNAGSSSDLQPSSSRRRNSSGKGHLRLARSIKKFLKFNDSKRAWHSMNNQEQSKCQAGQERLVNKPQVYVVGSPNPKSPFLRIAQVSDTCDVPEAAQEFAHPADVLVHCGNLCSYQFRNHFFKDSEFHNQLKEINNFFAQMPHKYKLFVPGPNEIFFDSESRDQIQALLPNCIYLQDCSCIIEGVKFYGVPWSASRRGAVGRGFGKSMSELRTVWSNVPDDVDVIISHSMPPTNSLYEELVTRLRPKLYMFGSRQQRSSRSDQGEENSVKFKDNIIFSNGHVGNAAKRGIFDFYTDDSVQRCTVLPEIQPDLVTEFPHLPTPTSSSPPRAVMRCSVS